MTTVSFLSCHNMERIRGLIVCPLSIRCLQGGLALASILESVVYATADMSVSESTTNSTPSDTWLGAMHNVDDGIDVLRYW